MAAPGPSQAIVAPDNLITRLAAVLEAEPRAFQVAINYGDATKLTGTCAAEQEYTAMAVAGRPHRLVQLFLFDT